MIIAIGKLFCQPEITVKGEIMKRLNDILLTCIFALSCLPGITGNAWAQQGEPVATFQFSTTTVQVGIGFTWGQGTLVFGDKVYSFDVGGLNLVGVGVSSALVKGEAYNMKSAEDFVGTYKGVAIGLTLAAGGTSVELTNENGVTMAVDTQSEGVQLNVGGGGLKIKNMHLIELE